MFVIKKKNEKNKTIFHYNKPSRSCDDEIYRQRYYLMVSQRFVRSDNIYSPFFFSQLWYFHCGLCSLTEIVIESMYHVSANDFNFPLWVVRER